MTVVKVGSLGTRRTLRKLKQSKKSMPLILGNQAKNHFKAGFRRGGFTDNGFRRWLPRRKVISRTKTHPTATEASFLTRSRALSRSVQVRVANFKRIQIGTRGIPYATVHNEGEGDMPQRQFIGDSKVLEARLKRRIKKEIDKGFK